MRRSPATRWALSLSILSGCGSDAGAQNLPVALTEHPDRSCTGRIASVTSVLVRVSYGNTQDAPCQSVAPRSDVAGLAEELAMQSLRFRDIPAAVVTVQVHGYREAMCSSNALVLCGSTTEDLNSEQLDRIIIQVQCSEDPMASALRPCRQ